ncbi:peptidyl-tRNA hydrolase Pth2 [Candidatus Woesearchaeota archaeon]|nr:peptidyl-tRNA hydrolase Pth2 [Candidatus Woesearchaeota archaeon]
MKQVILVRKDLNLPKGKLAVQAAHASVRAVLVSDRRKVDRWDSEGAKKAVLKVADLRELKKYISKAKTAKLKTAVITDAGKTVIAPGTTTCIAIGPDDEEKIDKITGNLKLI